MSTWLWDVRYAVRTLSKSPLFSLVAIATLALGIGANTAIFSVVDAVLVRPLPFRDPARLVVLQETRPKGAGDREVSGSNFLDWRREARSFEGMAAWILRGVSTKIGDQPEQIGTARVSPSLFALLGVRPALGREFLPAEEEIGRSRVVVLGDKIWRTRFAADPAAVGRTVRLDDEPYTIVGVMPAGFRFPDDESVAIWMPLAFEPSELEIRRQRMFHVVARLGPRTDLRTARAEMSGIASRLAAAYPASNREWGASVTPLADVVVGPQRPLRILLGAVALLLLIGCSNVANLLLARSAARARERSIALALGCSPARLVRQAFIETLVLAAAGGACGILLASASLGTLVAFAPDDLPRWNTVTLNGSVLLFASLLSLATAAVAGILPALRAARSAAVHPGSAAATAASSRPRTRWAARDTVVAAEAAMAVLLLVGAILLVRSLGRLYSVTPGFDPDRLLVANLTLPEKRYPDSASSIRFFERVLERVEAAPGVEAAAFATTLPMNPVGIDYDLPFAVEGEAPRETDSVQADFRAVSPGLFRTLRIPVVKGRAIGPLDKADSPLVAVVSESMARRYFAGRDPIGSRFRIYGGKKRLEVVGVVGDVRHRGLDDGPRPSFYVPYTQMPHSMVSLVVRTSHEEPLGAAGAVRRAIEGIDPDEPLANLTTMSRLVEDSTAARRYRTVLLGAFAACGLTLAGSGLFGVLSYAVSRRTREIGIRMSLGARAGDVLWLIVRQGMRVSILGLGAGLVAAAVATRGMKSLLFEIAPLDAPTYAAAALVLISASLAAAYFPARRAARIDPIQALKTD